MHAQITYTKLFSALLKVTGNTHCTNTRTDTHQSLLLTAYVKHLCEVVVCPLVILHLYHLLNEGETRQGGGHKQIKHAGLRTTRELSWCLTSAQYFRITSHLLSKLLQSQCVCVCVCVCALVCICAGLYAVCN